MYNMEVSLFGYKVNAEILILIGIVYLIIVVNAISTTCNVHGIIEGLTSKRNNKEGFTGANTNFGNSSSYSLGNYKPVNTSSWSMPDLTITKGKPLSKGVQNILNRPSQPVPLPEGEMLMFANTPFKPECCPSTYSNSTGCACMTDKQYNYLIDRGGNNVPYSEY